MPWITSFGYGWQGQHPKVWAPMESPKGSAMKSFSVIKKKKKKKIRSTSRMTVFLPGATLLLRMWLMQNILTRFQAYTSVSI